jgi:hypothetical protein
MAVIGWLSGLSPFTCSKRALLGAACAYIAAVLAVKIINAILMNVIITDQMKQQEEKANGDTD